jgi:hypothetical protein
MKHTLVKWIKFLPVMLFVSYYLSATCFYHSHQYSWGMVIHSHFTFPAHDSTHHNHTESQCDTIHLLTHFVLPFIISFFIFCFKEPFIRLSLILPCKVYQHLHSIGLRGPPFPVPTRKRINNA